MSSSEPIEIVMPRLSDTMESGVVTRWLKQVGDFVASGEALLEVETDKATVEVESDEDGFLAEIVVVAESDAPVGSVVGWLVAEAAALVDHRGDDDTFTTDTDAGSANGHDVAPAPVVAREPSEEPAPDGDDPSGRKLVQGPGEEVGPLPTRVAVSPLARRLAREAKVEIDQLTPGSGPGGRVVRIDVQRATEARDAADGQEPSRSHRAMAAAMSRAKADAPHFYLSVDVHMDPLLELRRQLQEASAGPLSLTALLVKATAMAMERHPQMRRQWRDDRIQNLEHQDVGVAVAQPAGELIVPVLRSPASRSLPELSAELTDLAHRVRTTNRLPLSALGGAAITVSNLGGRGIREFYPIIDGGQSAIVGVGAVREELQLVDGSVRPCALMTLSMSVDHRVVAGAGAADFLVEIRHLLENPFAMVV